MPTQCSRDLFGYEVVEGRQVVAAFDGGDNTSYAGGRLLGATDRTIGLVGRFAACFVDGRAQAQVEHTVEAMVAQRAFGIAWSAPSPRNSLSLKPRAWPWVVRQSAASPTWPGARWTAGAARGA